MGLKNIEKAQVLRLGDEVEYQPGQIVSKTLAQNRALSMTLFAFEQDEEKKLHQAYDQAQGQLASLTAAHDYAGALEALTQLSAPINAFFDGVMVMAKDEKVKNNRLALLKSVNDLIHEIADFTQLVTA